MVNNNRRDAGDKQAAEAAARVRSGAVEDPAELRVLDRPTLVQHGAPSAPADDIGELDDTCQLPLAAGASSATISIDDKDARLAEQAQELTPLRARIAASEQALRDAEQRAEAFEQLLTEAGEEIADLRSKLAARDALVQRLEAAAAKPAAVLPTHSDAAAGECVDIGLPVEAQRSTRKMIVVTDGERRTSYVLHKSETTIGRATLADIRLPSPFISRIHARISMRDAQTFIEDLGSKNGILLNAQPVEERAPLHDGDIVNLGGMLELEYIDFERSAAGL